MSNLKQGVKLKQSQNLALTPQLKQSLNILAFNSMELELEVKTMLEKNIILEDMSVQAEFMELEADYTNDETKEFDDIPEQLEMDADWQDIYNEKLPKKLTESQSSEEFQADWIADDVSFEDRLESSIRTFGFSEKQLSIAEKILENLDDNYFLTVTKEQLAKQLKVDLEEIKYIIDKIKHLDPVGVASSDIADCLLTQLQIIGKTDEEHLNAYEIIKFYFDYIAENQELIQTRMGITGKEFHNAMQIISTLNPFPNPQEEIYNLNIQADVFIQTKMGFYYASRNENAEFDLAINQDYASLAKQSKGDDKKFLTAQIQEAKWFIETLKKRGDTIVKVANAIIMKQKDFFIDGKKALKPLMMKEIAEILDINESTVSRSVNGKYLSFNNELYELRIFFSQEIETSEDQAALSSMAIKEIIKEIIENEDRKKPLSDSKIERLLKDKSIKVARRTIAKYREALGFSNASERKQLR